MGNQESRGSAQDALLLGLDERALWDESTRELLTSLSLGSYKGPSQLLMSASGRTSLPAEDPSSLLASSSAAATAPSASHANADDKEKNAVLGPNVKAHLMTEIEAMAHDKTNNDYSIDVAARSYVIDNVYAALARQVAMEKRNELDKKKENKRQSEAAFPPLSAVSNKGLSAIVTINLQLLGSVLERNDHKLLNTVLTLAASTLSETPALSLAPSPSFSPDIATVVCQPLLSVLRQIVVDSKQQSDNRNSALGVMFGMALARGSVAEVLAVVDTLLDSSTSSFTVAQFISTMVAFQPKPVVATAELSASAADAEKAKRELRAFYEGTRWNYYTEKTNGSSMCTIDFNTNNRCSSSSYGSGDWSVSEVEGGKTVVMNLVFYNISQVCTLEPDKQTWIGRRHDGRVSKGTWNSRIIPAAPESSLDQKVSADAGPSSSATASRAAIELSWSQLVEFPATADSALSHFGVVTLPPIIRAPDAESKERETTPSGATPIPELGPIASAVLVSGQLDRLSAAYATGATATAVLLDPLRIECTPKVLMLLSKILMRSATLYLSAPDEAYPSPDNTSVTDFQCHALIVTFALRILKAHLHQLVLSGIIRDPNEFSISEQQLEALRSLVFRLMRSVPVRPSANGLIKTVIQAEASDCFYSGFTAFYPSVDAQLMFVVESAERKNPSPADTRLLPLLLTQFSTFSGLSFCLDGLELDPTTPHGEKTAHALRRLFTGLIASVEQQSLDALLKPPPDAKELTAMEAAGHASEKEQSAVNTAGGALTFLKSFQRHLFARAAQWFAKHAEEAKKQSDRDSGLSGNSAQMNTDGTMTTDGKIVESKNSDGLFVGKEEKDYKSPQSASLSNSKTAESESSSALSPCHTESKKSVIALTTDRVCSVVVEYTVLVATACTRVLAQYEKLIYTVRRDDSLSLNQQWAHIKYAGEDILRQRSIVGELGRGIIHALALFIQSANASRTRPELPLRLLPVLTQLIAINQRVSGGLSILIQAKDENKHVQYIEDVKVYERQKTEKEKAYKKAVDEWKAGLEAFEAENGGNNSDDDSKSGSKKKKKANPKEKKRIAYRASHPMPARPSYGAPPKKPDDLSGSLSADMMVNYERTIYIESEHPYPVSTTRERVITIPGSEWLRISFERCELSSTTDYIEFSPSAPGLPYRITGLVGANNAPVQPILFNTGKVTLKMVTQSVPYRAYGYRLKVTGHTKIPALEWLTNDWVKLCVWVAGACVSRLLQSTPVVSGGAESQNQDWLESGLFQGGLSSDAVAFPAIDKTVLTLANAYNTSIPDVAPSKSDEKSVALTVRPESNAEEKAVIDGLLAGSAAFKPLLSELERRAAFKFLLPPSIKEPSDRVTRAIFTVALKHNHLLSHVQALNTRLSPVTAGTAILSVDEKRHLNSMTALFKKRF